jgi:hypothetical protein
VKACQIKIQFLLVQILVLLGSQVSGQSRGWSFPTARHWQTGAASISPVTLRYLQKTAPDLQVLRIGVASTAVSVAGHSYVVFQPDSAGRWVPLYLAHRQFDQVGNLTGEFLLNYGNIADTVFKNLSTYDNAGHLLVLRSFVNSFGPLQEMVRHVYEYDSTGALRSFLDLERVRSIDSLDSNYVETYRYEYDVRGRVSVVDWRVHKILSQDVTDYRDTLLYQTPSSRIYAGKIEYQTVAGLWVPHVKEHFTLMDTAYNYYKTWKQYYWSINAWHLSIDGNTWTLPNGNYKGVRRYFDSNADTLRGQQIVEWGLDRRLPASPLANTQNVEGAYYGEFGELDSKVYERVVDIRARQGFSNVYVQTDSIALDGQNRVLVRSISFGRSFMDSSLSEPNTRHLRYVFTELGPTGIRPSTAPQTLAIAPGPSTQTVLLPALPGGTWNATLVDVQGRAIPLGSPEKSGIITMPSLATGVYSLHLTDKEGRHLHGRFVWER